MKATSLEQISTDYGIVMEHKEVALATLERKEQVQCVPVFSATDSLNWLDIYLQFNSLHAKIPARPPTRVLHLLVRSY